MKTKIFAVVALGLSLLSCDKFLDEKVYSLVDGDKIYQTYKEADMATMGIYNNLTSNKGGYHSHWQSLLVYGTDEARNYFVGEKINDQFYHVSNYSHTAGDSHLEALWNNIYSCIGKANDVYHSIEAMTTISRERKNVLQAEATFLRAFCYFNLVQLWGPVRLSLDKPTYGNVADRNAARSSVKDVYKQIAEDIEFAKTYLPVKQAEGYEGRATKYAAYGMAAKIYLTMASGSRFGVAGYEFFDPEEYYTLAKENADEVINKSGKQFDLLDDYAEVFSMSNKHNKEILFEACFGIDAAGNTYPKMGGPKGTGGGMGYATYGLTGRGYLRPTVYLSMCLYGTTPNVDTGNGNVNGIVSDDVRFDFNIVAKDINNQGWGTMKTNPENWYSRKFSLRQAEMSGFTWTATPMNQPILRYADVLLVYAEAAGMLDLSDQKAYDAINEVRKRARRTGTNPDYLEDFVPGDFADIDSFMDAILDERMRELCFEGHRRFDLLRTSRLFTAIERMKQADSELSTRYGDNSGNLSKRAVNADYQQTNFDVNLKPYHILFPIPQYEMNIVTNPEYKQNPNW